MTQKHPTQRYEFYRNLPFDAPSLVSSFQKLDQSPDNPRFHFELGEAALQVGLLDLSVACFVTVTELAPHVEAGFFNLGNAYFELREYGKAKQAYEQALVLNPDCDTLNNLGNTFAAMEDWENAIGAFDRALGLPASQAQIRTALGNKGRALLGASDRDGAIENYQQALLQFPNDIQFLALKANCHRQKFEFGKAIECLVIALEASPNNPELLCEIAQVNFCRGRTLESVLCMNQAFTLSRPPANLHSRWLQMLSFCEPSSPEGMLIEAKVWAASLRQSTAPSPKPSSPGRKHTSSQKPLRVGILCHSLSSRGLLDWLPECLAKCDATQLQCLVFCDSRVHSNVQNVMARIGCHLEVTSQLSDGQLSTRIQEQQIDVLIDMIGHGLSNRLQVIASKPAPIQVSWCAFPMTSGLSQMDFMWSDQVSIPQDMEEFVVEKVVRLPTSSLCFLPSRTLDLKPPTDSGLHPFRCGFLGKPEQISEPLLAAMQSILVSISDAELVFSGLEYRDKAFQNELREKFSRTPDVTDRIRFECFESDEAELNSYQQLDVTLDPFLVSSPQRSFESLWMGVPVVTLLDKRMSARGTASILQALGSQHWIANSPSEYVNLVKQLAESRDQWRSRRPQLRAALLASPMCDAAAIAQSIQDAIKQSIRQSPFAATPT